MILEASYCCAWCAEWVEGSFDPGQGRQSEYVEDCQVCCRPNLLRCQHDPRTRQVRIHAERM